MMFWVDWQLWEKLTLAMGILIVVVFSYALCVLGWSRRKMRKCAIAEVTKQEMEAEIYPMLHKNDIPFGARALESGIEIEGIWNSNTNTPVPSPRQPATPVGSRTASPVPQLWARRIEDTTSSLESQSPIVSLIPVPQAARRGLVSELDLASADFVHEPPRPGGFYNNRASLPINPTPLRISPAREETLVGVKDPIVRDKRASFHSRIFASSRHREAKDYRSGLDEADEEAGYIATMAGTSPHSTSGHKRVSRFTKGLRRRSSEEFRRKMSQIFNDNIHIGLPAEQLEFDPALREYQKPTFRESLLRPFRPWRDSSANESQ